MKVRNLIRQAPLETDGNRKALDDIYTLSRGNISYGTGINNDVEQNISGAWVAATTPVTPDTDFTVTHNLNRVPVGFHLVFKNASCDVYNGSIAATEVQMTFKANVASVNIKLFIF